MKILVLLFLLIFTANGNQLRAGIKNEKIGRFYKIN